MLPKVPDIPLDGDFWRPTTASLELARYPILSSTYARAHPYEAIKSHYEQARAICKAHALSVEDVLTLSPKFWKLHADPAVPRMSAAFTLIGSQYNLVVGTIAPYAKRRPELLPLLQRLMAFDVSGIYMLTELGHGLDARNLQTVATLLPDGGFDLHTPTPDAAKTMPAATPISSMEKMAIVFARLQIGGKDNGIRGFIVTLNDGENMAPGITAKLLPNRAGAHYLDHSITTFNHVYLSKEALLGELTKDPAADAQEEFSNLIWRVPIGTLSLTMSCIPVLKAASWIAARYAMKRTVGGDISSSSSSSSFSSCSTIATATATLTVSDPVQRNNEIPIIEFRTQQIPICHALAQGAVLAEFAAWSVNRFVERVKGVDNRLRHAHAMLFKTVAIGHALTSTRILAQEIGWRGLFEDNEIIRFELETRGVKIAEGDITVLCIRLASDILYGKITLPTPLDSSTLLAQHENILVGEARALLLKCNGNFRSPAANRYLLPHCRTLVKAIGHRMAYEAAAAADIDPVLLKLYEVGAVKSDLACYVEHGLVSRSKVVEIEDSCITDLMKGKIWTFLSDIDVDVGTFCDAPILSGERWGEFLGTLDTFNGQEVVAT